LKTASRTARAEVFLTELLIEFFIAVYNAPARLDCCFGGIAAAPFAGGLKSGRGPQVVFYV